MTHVVPIFKLAKILPKMLPADMDMRSVNAALQLRPESLHRVDASALGGRVLPLAVVDGDMAIAGLSNVLIAAKFIGIERCSRQDMAKYNRLHGLLGARMNNPRYQFATALQHPDNASLVALVPAALAGHRAAYQRFVNLDRFAKAAKRIVTIERRHIFADFMAHAPSGFVRHAKLALDFLSGNPIARGAEQENNIEPIPQRRARPVHGRVGSRIDLMAAKITSVRAPFRDRVKLGFALAFIAGVRDAVACIHKVRQTGFFRWETLLKLAKSGGFRFHSNYIAPNSPWRKGIIANLFQGLSQNKHRLRVLRDGC